MELSLSNQRRYSIRKANYIIKKVSKKQKSSEQKSSEKSSPKSVNEFNSPTLNQLISKSILYMSNIRFVFINYIIFDN